MNTPLLTLFRYIFGLVMGAVIVPVLFTSHDITLWRVGMAAGVIVVAGVIFTLLEMAIVKAAED